MLLLPLRWFVYACFWSKEHMFMYQETILDSWSSFPEKPCSKTNHEDDLELLVVEL